MKTKITPVEQARLEYQAVWIKACRHEGIDPRIKFVELSRSNPFLKDLARADDKYLRACAKAGVWTL